MNPKEEVRPNQKMIDEARKAREVILERLKQISPKYPDGFVSTQQLANALYPNGPYYTTFRTQGSNPINVNGDLLLSRLKKMKKEGLVEVRKVTGKCIWKHVSNE